jgi:hypothetical protein
MNILEYILIGIVASFALWYAVLNLYRVFFLSKKKFKKYVKISLLFKVR